MSASYVPFVARALKPFKFDSVYEFACGDGQNLRELSSEFPNATLKGSDIEGDKWGYPTYDIREPFVEESVDVVICAATLLLFDDEQVKVVIENIKKAAKKFIVLVELDNAPANGGTSTHPRYSREYSKLFGEPLSKTVVPWPGHAEGSVMVFKV